MRTLSLRKININIFILFLLSIISLASPIITHYFGFKGTEFLPIFFALSLGSYILNPIFLIILSFISPLLNHFLTNMPMPPTLYFLIFEGLVFSTVISMMKNKNISFILTSLFAFILGRLSSVILTFIFDININTWLNGLILGYKGIIVNWIFASIMYLILKDKINE
ncbi:hypothetical protein OFQ54_08060 [Brachyspira hyodysenteriae]|uniref:hypothetical protein n=1 Tax=Brachyspira hyodysenteriae TaxID=159 RepID=UPI00063D8994|nr:hypothetical protein [Brachyspira hyodysenteriae]KLI20204.1 membrane protein [Brachyspira hyodysenteriae]KLI38209.1 membrane protein [Brachyspira hyodysenteriae]MCZ9961774.1 hypothetical protein [Brachyspira hyodysenteriae]